MFNKSFIIDDIFKVDSEPYNYCRFASNNDFFYPRIWIFTKHEDRGKQFTSNVAKLHVL